MISYIKGTLIELAQDHVVVEAGTSGIGYLVFIPTLVLDRLPGVGSEIKLYTHFQVREDGMSLFGFLSAQDKEMFRQLIGVNGIGPKAGLAILSVLSPDDLRMAIISGDAKSISRAPGVGAKTAQRVILDLKDKVSLDDILPSGDDIETSTGVFTAGLAGTEAIQALTALGYSSMEATKAVRKVEISDDMDAETVLKSALRFLI